MAVKLHEAGERHARDLIRAGKVDQTSDWAFTTEDEDRLLGDPPDWAAYAAWFLGQDTEADTDTKAAWKYPAGKDGKIYRSALSAIRTRSAQQAQQDIFDAAGRLLEAMDKNVEDRARAGRRGPRRAPLARAAADRGWYRINVQAADPAGAGAVADVLIYDFIGDWCDDYWGFGVTAKAFLAELAQLPDSVTAIRVRINSPGGDVFAAVAIANMLRDQVATKKRRVETLVEGLAASAASIVMVAGELVRVADNALVMIHNPWTIAWGEAGELRQTADQLDKVRAAIIATYRWKSPLAPDAVGALMDAETWMDADEAIAHGFCDEKVAGLRAVALLDPGIASALAVPDRYRGRLDAILRRPAAAAEILDAVEGAGLGTGFARDLIGAALPMDQVQARIEAAKSARATLDARAAEIRGLCALAQLPELADGYVQGGMSASAVKVHLTTITAKLDRAEIDSGLGPEHREPRPAARLDPAAIYAARNQLVATKGV